MDDYYRNALRVVAISESFGLLSTPKRQRRYWVHPYCSNREEMKRFTEFYSKIREYPDKFFKYYRMSIQSFDELLFKLRLSLTKQETTFRKPICAEERLTLTLRYLIN